MSTISVPLSPELQKQLDHLVADGVGSNRADVMRRALERFAKAQAVQAVLDASREPTLRGNLRDLAKKIN